MAAIALGGLAGLIGLAGLDGTAGADLAPAGPFVIDTAPGEGSDPGTGARTPSTTPGSQAGSSTGPQTGTPPGDQAAPQQSGPPGYEYLDTFGSYSACSGVGRGGVNDGTWKAWHCEDVGYGYDFWVKY